MWLSENAAKSGRKAPETVCEGSVSIGGADSAVLLEGEARRLGVCAPGGMVWLPENGQQVVVLKSAEGAAAIAGCTGSAAPDGMESGEIYLFSHGARYI